MATRMMGIDRLTGIDISEWQDNVNWDELCASDDKPDFAILRGGYGRKHRDACFVEHATNCIQRNIPIGIYWFSYAWDIESARTEAQSAVSLASSFPITYPIFFDFEGDSYDYAYNHCGVAINKLLLSEMARTFCNTVKEAGYEAGIYINYDFLRYYTPEVLDQFALWMVDLEDQPKRTVQLWQCGKKKLAGFPEPIDCNVSFVDYADKPKKASVKCPKCGAVIKYCPCCGEILNET